MKIYKSFRKYCIYKNEEYPTTLRSNGNLYIITYNKEKLKEDFEKEYNYYIKTIDKSEADDFYQLYTSVVYRGFSVYGGQNAIRLDGSSDGRDPVANILGMEMHNRGEYTKNIIEDEIDCVDIARLYTEDYSGFKFDNDDVNKIFEVINFNEKGKYNGKEYNVSIKGDKVKLSTQDITLIDDTFNKEVFKQWVWYRKEIELTELDEHYGTKCFGIYKGVKCEVYSVIPGIVLTVAPDTEEDKQKLLDLGFYISNTDLNYCEKIVKPEDVELVYERIEMGMFK